MHSIFHQKKNLPSLAPVMVLPGALLFPHALLPLRIFEPRYREMLARALEGDRMFCIALMRPDVTEARSDDDFYHVAGVGLVRACITAADGASNLVLQGIARVRMLGFVQRVPYRIAEIRELPSEPGDELKAAALAQRIVEQCREMKIEGIDLPSMLKNTLADARDPDFVADIVTHAFIADPFRRQEIFESLSVTRRLRLLAKYLAEEASG